MFNLCNANSAATLNFQPNLIPKPADSQANRRFVLDIEDQVIIIIDRLFHRAVEIPGTSDGIFRNDIGDELAYLQIRFGRRTVRGSRQNDDTTGRPAVLEVAVKLLNFHLHAFVVVAVVASETEDEREKEERQDKSLKRGVWISGRKCF